MVETIAIQTQQHDSFPFHQLVSDCRKLILKYRYHWLSDEAVPYENQMTSNDPHTRKIISDLEFALEYFCCCMIRGSISRHELPWIRNLYSLHFSKSCNSLPPGTFDNFRNLRELNLAYCNDLRNEYFKYFESVEVLTLGGFSNEEMTDDAFLHTKNLRELDISFCTQFTDQAIENLYNAGSKLQKLNIADCKRMTNQALSFLAGSITDLNIGNCPLISDSGLKHVRGTIRNIHVSGNLTSNAFVHLKGLKELHMGGMELIDCHEAFKHLEGSIEQLHMAHCHLDSLDERSFRYLRGISTLKLHNCTVDNLTDECFRFVSGTIKSLTVSSCKSKSLSKNFLFHLSGIEKISFYGIDGIISEDLPRLKEVLSKVSLFSTRWDSGDKIALLELRDFIRKRGGSAMVSL